MPISPHEVMHHGEPTLIEWFFTVINNAEHRVGIPRLIFMRDETDLGLSVLPCPRPDYI